MSDKLTCPNCGVSSEDHAVVMVTEDMGSCNACGAVWNESDKAVKRIRALEAERDEAILDAKMWKQVANLLDNKAKRLEADNARLAGERDNAVRGLANELEKNDRLTAELAEARATGARRKEAELMHDLSVALGAGGQECDVFAEIQSLRARLAEVEADNDKLNDSLYAARSNAGTANRAAEDLELRLAEAEKRVVRLDALEEWLRLRIPEARDMSNDTSLRDREGHRWDASYHVLLQVEQIVNGITATETEIYAARNQETPMTDTIRCPYCGSEMKSPPCTCLVGRLAHWLDDNDKADVTAHLIRQSYDRLRNLEPSVAGYLDLLDQAQTTQAALETDNARLVGEAERLRIEHQRDTDYITELYREKEEFQADRNMARGEIEDEWRPLTERLTAELAEAKKERDLIGNELRTDQETEQLRYLAHRRAIKFEKEADSLRARLAEAEKRVEACPVAPAQTDSVFMDEVSLDDYANDPIETEEKRVESGGYTPINAPSNPTPPKGGTGESRRNATDTEEGEG